MSHSLKKSKRGYNQDKKMAEGLLNGYESFRVEQDRKLNLQEINELEYDIAISNYEDQLFYYEFAAWEYEMWQALQEFKAARNDFLSFDKAGHYIEEINSASPKKKVNYSEVEAVARLQRQVAESSYKMLVDKSKQVPVHLSEKKKFPFKEIGKTN